MCRLSKFRSSSETDGDVKGVDTLATFLFNFFFQELGHFIHIYKSTGPSEGTLKVKGKFYLRTHIQIINTYSVLKRERNTTRSVLKPMLYVNSYTNDIYFFHIS